MNAFRWGILMLLLVTALGVVDLVVELQHLPEEVATQFNFDGEPGGYSSRAGLSWGHGIALAAVLLAMGALPAVLPKLPLALLNVPHKDYWFAPERRARSWTFVQAWMAWFGAWTQGFMLAIFHGIHRFNRAGDSPTTIGGWIPMAVYFAGIGIGLFLLFARFGKPPAVLLGILGVGLLGVFGGTAERVLELLLAMALGLQGGREAVLDGLVALLAPLNSLCQVLRFVTLAQGDHLTAAEIDLQALAAARTFHRKSLFHRTLRPEKNSGTFPSRVPSYPLKQAGSAIVRLGLSGQFEPPQRIHPGGWRLELSHFFHCVALEMDRLSGGPRGIAASRESRPSIPQPRAPASDRIRLP